jgi:NAD(P)-dependent dehydrogenase (short-subunit alcohol dehydrogenase family)
MLHYLLKIVLCNTLCQNQILVVGCLMPRRVLITGSEGHLGRALRTAFEAQGDVVIGLDLPGSGADYEVDLDDSHGYGFPSYFNILIANAKCSGWGEHHFLAEQATSCIVNIGSIYGVLGNDPQMYEGTEVEKTPAWYAASKGALIALTRWQSTNLAPVRSNAICPGGIFRGHSDKFRERYEARVPLRRMATEDDIVGPVLFLCSEAASYITGQVLMVDGGYSAW